MSTHSTATAAQAWAILSRHARDEIAHLRLQELCRDNDRVSSLVSVYNTSFQATSFVEGPQAETTPQTENRMLIADLSRQRMTLETLTHLLKLASAKHLRKYITQLAWGQNDPRRPTLPERVQQSSSHTQHQQSNARDNNNNAPISKTTRFGGEDLPNIQSTGTFDTMTTTAIHEEMHHFHHSSGKPGVPSMHMALRVPAGRGYEMITGTVSEGKSNSNSNSNNNALTEIHQEWRRIQLISDSIRRGQLRGVSSSMIRDVVVVGRGVAVAALQFVYQALLRDERAVLASKFGLEDTMTSTATRIRLNLTGNSGSNVPSIIPRRLKFLTRVDPVASASVVSDLDPASTLVISIALNGNEETGLATKTLKSWLLQGLGSNRRPDHVLAKHMMLVTGNERIASVINKPESVHVIPEHSRCEAFTTFTAASLLPLSIVYGWSLVDEFLAGAHDMDNHFVDTNPRHNLPVLLALTDVWNDTLLGSCSRFINPFSEAFFGFAAFVATLEAQTCSRALPRSTTSNIRKTKCSSLAIDGGANGSYDRSLYQSENMVNSEIVAVLDSQVRFNTSRTIGSGSLDDVYSAQDAALCSMFAHCDELAFGSEKAENSGLAPTYTSPYVRPYDGEFSEGNRPSILLLCGKLDAFTCGQLVALAEHRAAVKAHLWGMDAFVQEIGSSLQSYRSDLLKDELQFLFSRDPEETDEDVAVAGPLILSTKTILDHYAKQMQGSRLRTVK